MQPFGLSQRRALLADAPVLTIMALGLALFYIDGLPLPLRLAGLALFAGLAALQPAGGLISVVLTAPLYLIPTAVDMFGRAWLFPLHEVALLLTTAAVAGRWTIQVARHRHAVDFQLHLRRVYAMGGRYAPHVLLALAGIIGVVIAVPEGRSAALREFRWLIAEPLLFYGLGRVVGVSRLLLGSALAVSGAYVALIGVLQYGELDLAPLLGEKQAFSENIIDVDGVRRVTSVYGHPNNLGLFLERVWPLAAVIAIGVRRGDVVGDVVAHTNRRSDVACNVATLLLFTCCALLALAGVGVSFSRGAWLASVIAATVVGAGWFLFRSQDRQVMRWSALALAGVVIAVVAGLALTLRGGPGGGSTDARLLLWRESLAYLQQHPFGLGLDQFYYFHNPEFGRSLIDPSLLGTSEAYAAHPHNLILDAWINTGPIGVIAFGWLMLRFFRNAIGALRERRDLLALGALAAMSAALVHGLVDRFYFVPDLAITFWVLIALADT
ncbi:O-antigen ligase family protein [Roseiflexus sp.]|uniref:O-antigen ligase family protein n=3 Tax=Roseiflexus sp. TaxID=2562120 RepID=UPI00398B9F19